LRMEIRELRIKNSGLIMKKTLPPGAFDPQPSILNSQFLISTLFLEAIHEKFSKRTLV